MSATLEDHRNRLLMLYELKEQYQAGTSRRRLYEVFRESGQPLEKPRLEWMHAAGMGDFVLFPASEQESKAINCLMKEGRVVPTFREYYYFLGKDTRLITHFDDVKFGLTDAQDMVIFRLSPSPDANDSVITPDERHDAAIAELKKRMKYQLTINDDPIQLRGGPIVTPILTDLSQIELRKRQKALTNG